MTARETFRTLWRAARIERRRRISPDYVDTITAGGVVVLVYYDNRDPEARRDGIYRHPARHAWHLDQAAVARRNAASLPIGLTRLIALDDHARHIAEHRRQPR